MAMPPSESRSSGSRVLRIGTSVSLASPPGIGRSGRDGHHPARRVAVRTEPEGCGVERERTVAVWQAEAAVLRHDEQALVLDEDPVAALDRRLRSALGRRERGAEDVTVERQVHGERGRHSSLPPVHHG